MNLKILAIEQGESLISDLSKFTKSKIRVFNIESKKRKIVVYSNAEILPKKLSAQIEKINEIKNDYDLCIVSSWNAARIAYLCDLNYIIWFIGNDIRIPPFIKNSKPEYFEIPVNNLSNIQRRFYKKVFESANICVTGSQELFLLLKKLRSDAKRIDRFVVDTSIFKPNLKPKNFEKKKFSFFCPQRIGIEKGTDVLWEAIKMTKSDFEILQVNWLDQKTPEIEKQSLDLLKAKPKKIKLIPKIERKDMPEYYSFADAILGEMQSGHLNYTECEALLCDKPVLCYNDPNCKYLINGDEISSPFVPKTKDPKHLANLIDNLVQDSSFKNSLKCDESKFVKEIADPYKAAKEWEELFQVQYKNWNLKQKKINWLKRKYKILSYRLAFFGKVGIEKVH